MKRTARLAIVFAVLTSTITILPAAPALACSGRAGARGANETYRLETFEVTMKSVRKTYERGQSARINMTVVRPGKSDPLGQGIPIEPPQQWPAEGVTVGVGLRIGDVFLAGFATTGADGKAVVEIPIRSYVPRGRALAIAQAVKRQVDSPCATVEEFGYTQSPSLFKVN